MAAYIIVCKISLQASLQKTFQKNFSSMAKQVEKQNQEFIDELMGFDPSQVAAFNEPEQKSNQNQNLYKTNPLKVDPKIAPDGH